MRGDGKQDFVGGIWGGFRGNPQAPRERWASVLTGLLPSKFPQRELGCVSRVEREACWSGAHCFGSSVDSPRKTELGWGRSLPGQQKRGKPSV